MTVLPKFEQPGCGCDAPVRLSSLLSIDEALALIDVHAKPVAEVESLSLARAQGRVLAGPVVCRGMTPPFDNAAMDGYALNSTALAGEGPWTLAIAGRVPAGQAPVAMPEAESAVRIFTGAPVPQGADAVMMQEDVERVGDTIRLARRPSPGSHIRRTGEDMMPGDIILDRGGRIGPREIAACAAAGFGTVTVRRRIRVALLVTGDEVRQAGEGIADGQIWDINTPMLTALLAVPSVDVVAVRRAADNRGGLEGELAELAGMADLVITTGGVSVGEEDHVKPALDALGAEKIFAGVAIKPGKPVAFGKFGGAFWLGLPGNPLSAFVTWQVFGVALLHGLSGRIGAVPLRHHVVTGQDIIRKPGRYELRPARIEGFDESGREVVGFDRATHSARMAHLPQADGLMFIPAEVERLSQGALVEFQPFHDV